MHTVSASLRGTNDLILRYALERLVGELAKTQRMYPTRGVYPEPVEGFGDEAQNVEWLHYYGKVDKR